MEVGYLLLECLLLPSQLVDLHEEDMNQGLHMSLEFGLLLEGLKLNGFGADLAGDRTILVVSEDIILTT